MALLFYGNYYLILPIAIKRFNTYGIFIGIFFAAFLVVGIRSVIDQFYYSGFYFNGQEFLPFPGRVLSTGLFLSLSTVLAILEQNEKLKKKELLLITEKMEAELNYLKMQINPHFLFNTLNDIYTLTYLKDDKAPQIIMKLSNIMRYMLYECREKRVTLDKEMNMIENYIQLKKIKNENMRGIEFTRQSTNSSHQIAPLILINFVENAFKHSAWNNTKESWVKINNSITTSGLFHFNIKNSIGTAKVAEPEIGGVGLANAKKQLELHYPDKYTLTMVNNNNEFEIDLQIQLD